MAVRPIDASGFERELIADMSLYGEKIRGDEAYSRALLLLAGAPTLAPPNEWVSVEERLPEKHSEYIVCACDEGEPIDERIWGDTVVVCADYYDGAFTWYAGNTEYDISDIVTHWMPIPEPPDRRPPEGEEETE